MEPPRHALTLTLNPPYRVDAPLYGQRPRDAPPVPASGTPSSLGSLVSDRLGDFDHRSTTSRRELSCTPALDSRLHAYPLPHRPNRRRVRRYPGICASDPPEIEIARFRSPVPTAGRSSAPADARGSTGPFVTSFDCPPLLAAPYSERTPLFTANALAMRRRSQTAGRPPASPCIRPPRIFGPQEHHQPPCIVVYARFRRTAARLSAPTSPRSAGEFAVIRHRAPLTPEIEIARFQSEVRQTEPNQTERPPSLGIRRSPRPVRRPSADPVLPQPMSFTSSDVAVFLSARRDEASANDTPGSQIEELMTPK
ncbi:hypothetical protein THAOC_35437 [Thalassiosira oceanica]|uniref:Uncharacterized protein n=1 Tax=Thalassiosira oceanica TaxID=159749 RepID=K0R3D4_THAOC|nr:hypothetical protein THAOC_35437 [Thalassiosira oceanica]|eukprot:EJK45924.1 hypothetical protein THAOC_35437 [Thalassiosira oceanica]